VRFSAPVQTGPGAHPASCTMGTGYFQGVEQPERGVDRPLPSSTEVKERIEVHIYSPCGLSWLFLGWNLPLPFFNTGWRTKCRTIDCARNTFLLLQKHL